MRCSVWIPIKDIDTNSILPPSPMTTQMPPAEEFPRIQGKMSRKICKVKQDSTTFARYLECRTWSTYPTLTDPAMIWSTWRIILSVESLTATISLSASRNRMNPGKSNSRGSRWRPKSFINLLPRLSRIVTSRESQRRWRTHPTLTPTPIPTLNQDIASNNIDAGTNSERNQLSRSAQWINTSYPRSTTLTPRLVNSFRNIPTVINITMMNLVRAPIVRTSIHLRMNKLLDDMNWKPWTVPLAS